MKELSVFIDESGDFGEFDPKSPYYIIGMVLHNQKNDISSQIQYLNKVLSETELKRNFVHMGPLIRHEREYRNLTPSERVRIIRKMINFTSKVEFLQKAFVVKKKQTKDDTELIERLVRQMSDFIKVHYAYFLSFDKIKIYYDNGQSGVMKIIITVFTTLFNNAKFKKAMQADYKMLQVADLVCTAKLTELKMKNRVLSTSERRILGSDRDINKNLLKPLARKEAKDLVYIESFNFLILITITITTIHTRINLIVIFLCIISRNWFTIITIIAVIWATIILIYSSGYCWIG